MSSKEDVLQRLSKSPSWWRKAHIITKYYDNIVSGSYTEDMMPLSFTDAKKLKIFIESFAKNTTHKDKHQPTSNKVYNTGVVAKDNTIQKEVNKPKINIDDKQKTDTKIDRINEVADKEHDKKKDNYNNSKHSSKKDKKSK